MFEAEARDCEFASPNRTRRQALEQGLMQPQAKELHRVPRARDYLTVVPKTPHFDGGDMTDEPIMQPEPAFKCARLADDRAQSK